MRNMTKDILAVRADELRHADIPVVDRELVALADEPLDQPDERAFAKIVRPRLEAHPEHADAPPTVPLQHLERARDLQLVARKDRRKHRRLEVAGARIVRERPYVLRQA